MHSERWSKSKAADTGYILENTNDILRTFKVIPKHSWGWSNGPHKRNELKLFLVYISYL